MNFNHPKNLENRVRWGVIGSGGIARRRTIPEGIIPAKNAELVSLYDIDTDANNLSAREFNAFAAPGIDELLRSGIDAVYIATPVHLHLEQGIRCALAGKHILCEKPLGLSVSEAVTLGEVCREKGILLGTAFMMGFSSQHQAALDLVRKGKIGKPVFCRAQLSCWYPPIDGAWRQDPATSGGGALIDMGTHCLDLLEMYFGRIKKVSCLIRNHVHNYSSEDSALVSLVFENGAMGTVDSFFCIPDKGSKNMLELYGTSGSIIAEGTIGQAASGTMTAFLDDETSAYNPLQARGTGGGTDLNPEPVNTYCAEIEEFSSAILEGREPVNSYARGIHSQKVIEACYQSARTGTVIELI